MQIRKGLRIYGVWVGNPEGRKEDVTKCIETVCAQGPARMLHQCDRKRGFGKDGLYCKQHDPEVVKAREDERTRKYNEKWAKIREQATREGRYKAALEQIQEFDCQEASLGGICNDNCPACIAAKALNGE